MSQHPAILQRFENNPIIVHRQVTTGYRRDFT